MRPTQFAARVVVIAAAVVTVFPAAGAQATPATPQAQIDTQLRDYPGGVQTGPNEVSYRGGSVKLTIPAAGQVTATCPDGWYCFFQYKDFGGRILQFHDCGSDQFFSDYGFENRTSSWQNTTAKTVEVFDDEVIPWQRLWTENPTATSSDVGASADNKADFFTTYCP